MTTILLIRHGKTVTNKSGHLCGRTDSPLCEEGNEQIECLAKRFAEEKIDKIYASPLIRTVETAKAVNRAYRMDITLKYDLIEWNFGEMEGISFKELFENWAEDMDHYINHFPEFRPKGAEESGTELVARGVRVVEEIVRENRGKTVAVITHGDLLRAYLSAALGIDPAGINNVPYSENTGVTREDYDDDMIPHVIYQSDVSHLSKEKMTGGK